MQSVRSAGVSVLAVLTAVACSASSGPAGRAVGEEGNGGSNNIPGTGGASTGGAGGTIPGTGGTVPTSGNGGSSGSVCAPQSATGRLVKEPVDIIVVLDNSGSMHQEMKSVEENINVNFAEVLDTNSVDYRVILLSRHRDGTRTTGETEENTSICVAQPLGGLATCPGPDPVFTDRFFQYNDKVESDDSFDNILLWYDLADDDDDSLMPNGWGEWLRSGAKKVFIELTDDNENMTADEFTAALTAKSEAHFGTAAEPNFTFHSIIGIAQKAGTPLAAWLPDEPVEMGVCTGPEAEIVNPGVTYQNLSIATGGLRFPLCEFDGYDVVFRRIAEDVIVTSEIACSFPIPEPPPGTMLDRNNIAVNYTPGGGAAATKYGQAQDESQCQEDAFFIAADGLTIELCPETCAALQADPFARVDVLFTCESQIIPPR